MKGKEAFDNSLKPTKICLWASGISIYKSKWEFTKKYNLIFYFNLIWLYTDVFGEFFWLIEGIQSGKSFEELTMIAPCTTICLLATAKSVPLHFNRDLFIKVVNKLRQLHPIFQDEDSVKLNDNINDEDVAKDVDETKFAKLERKIVKDAIKFIGIVFNLISVCYALVVVVFSLTPIMAMVYDYYVDGETDLKLPFLIKYFFDPFTTSRWPLVYIHQVWSTVIVCFNIFGADTFLYAFCTYIQMHFQILCHRYEHMVSNSSNETRRRLVKLVRRHQDLIELVDSMEIMYSKSTLFNIVTSSVLICLSGFNVTILDDAGAVFAFLTFLSMSLCQISLLCFFGDMLQASSIKLSEAVYKCRWYDTDVSTRKSLFFVLTRSQKPCKLTAANFAVLNLSAFTTILSRSWSYFALLKTMYK